MDDLSQRVQAFLDAYTGDAPVPESVVEIVGDLENERRRLRAALEPFAKLHEARTAIYQKRGGDLDSFPDSHPAYDITAHQLRLGIWRRASDAYFGRSPPSAGEDYGRDG